MARETFRSGLVGGAGGPCRKQQGESRGDERRKDNSQTSTAPSSHIFCFRHVKLSDWFHNALQPGKHVRQGRVRENWVVPPGLRSFFPLFPALALG